MGINILSVVETFLAALTASDWVKIATAAPEIITALVKLGQSAGPVLSVVEKHVNGMVMQNNLSAGAALHAYQQLNSAWTAVDQRIFDQQNESRG